jgi:diguanylate cyclase (GGDEF)-like protein
MDVDNFKKYNDTYGHKMGDDVIKRRKSLGELVSADGNIPFRLGGEEFGAIVAAGAKRSSITLQTRSERV